MITEHHTMVRDFMRTFKQQLPKGFVDANDDVANGRFHMLEEEYKEWSRADPLSEELFDAQIDILYIAHGTLLALGLPLEASELKINHLSTNLTGRKLALHNECALALAAIQKRPLCRERLIPTLNNLIEATYISALANGMDIDRGFTAVHTANMRKLWTKEELPLAPNKQNTTQTQGPGGVTMFIVYNDYGKVVKPPGWRPANLRDIYLIGLRKFETPTAPTIDKPAAEPHQPPPASPPPTPPETDRKQIASLPQRRPVTWKAKSKS